jgi:hypothetical protein
MEIKQNIIEVENIENTLKKSDSYVHDMLKFYEEGWEARGIEDKEKFEGRIKANVINTLTYINEVLNYFKELNLHPKSAHIKLENPNSQTVLISVPLEDYINSELLKIYKHTHKIEKSSRSDNYRVSFSIAYDDGTLDSDCLSSEGFVKTHTITYN